MAFSAASDAIARAALCYARGVAKSKNLVESWLAAELAAGKTRTAAISELNAACGTAYTLSRIGEWENGGRDVPGKARRHMLRVALRHVLESEGVDVAALSPAALRRLADRLS